MCICLNIYPKKLKKNIYQINLEGGKVWLPNISFNLEFMDPKMKKLYIVPNTTVLI